MHEMGNWWCIFYQTIKNYQFSSIKKHEFNRNAYHCSCNVPFFIQNTTVACHHFSASLFSWCMTESPLKLIENSHWLSWALEWGRWHNWILHINRKSMLIPKGQNHWCGKLLNILVAPRHHSLEKVFRKSIQTLYWSTAGLINLLMVAVHVYIPPLLERLAQLAPAMKMEFVCRQFILLRI